ncbi:hypothetical protein MJO29_015922 [Puccinia striiformis f. sp. tritici]|nr:hypothetical protein MJO29_015911 [Puccinia striiformis f. sp. tritici]KAI7934659.1 hypothetical protein MJO29_015922 [Puccinia striiformis f. sp. tritici]
MDECTPGARHAYIILANTAFQQLALYTVAALAQHNYNRCFDDAANCQSEKWKEQHPAPHQMEEDFEGLDHYQTTVGGLLKHAKLVLAKDTELLYGQVHIKNIMNAQVTVPSLNDVQATLALEPTAGAP